MEKLLEIVKFFPMNLSNILYNTIISNNKIKDELQEIRIRIDRPLVLKLRDKELIVENYGLYEIYPAKLVRLFS